MKLMKKKNGSASGFWLVDMMRMMRMRRSVRATRRTRDGGVQLQLRKQMGGKMLNAKILMLLHKLRISFLIGQVSPPLPGDDCYYQHS